MCAQNARQTLTKDVYSQSIQFPQHGYIYNIQVQSSLSVAILKVSCSTHVTLKVQACPWPPRLPTLTNTGIDAQRGIMDWEEKGPSQITNKAL